MFIYGNFTGGGQQVKFCTTSARTYETQKQWLPLMYLYMRINQLGCIIIQTKKKKSGNGRYF